MLSSFHNSANQALLLPPMTRVIIVLMDDKTIRQIAAKYDVEEEEDVMTVINFFLSNDLKGFIASKILKEKTTQRLWTQLEESKDILHVRNYLERGPHKDLTAVIMGGCGNGKTSLLNNLCGTHHPTGESLHSQTRNITAEPVEFVADRGTFVVYDTPGTTAKEGISLHASLLRASLTHRPLNVVFVNIKFETRGIDVLFDMQKQIECLGQYANHVVYLVSHADSAKELPQMMSTMLEEMKKLKMFQQTVFYSNTRCDRKRLARTLYDIASNYPKVKINISEDDFLRKFRIGSLDRLFEKDFQQKLEEMEDLTDSYIRCAIDLPQNEEKQYMIQELALDLKYSLQERLEDFTQKAQELMLQHDYYGVYFALQKIILDSDEKFHLKTRNFLSFDMMHSKESDYKENILDLIKECPSCKQVWLRIEECPWATCGQRPISFWDYSVGRTFFTYAVKREGRKITIQRKERMREATESEIRISKRFELNVEQSRYFKGIWEKKKEEEDLKSDIKRFQLEEESLLKQLEIAKSNKCDAQSVKAKETVLRNLLDDINRDTRRCRSDIMLISCEARRSNNPRLKAEEASFKEALKKLPNIQRFELRLDKIRAEWDKVESNKSAVKTLLWNTMSRTDEIARDVLAVREELNALRERCRQILSEYNLSLRMAAMVTYKGKHNQTLRSIGERIVLAKLENVQQELVNNRDELRSLEEKHQQEERKRLRIVGCGFRMNFHDLPRIHNIDKKLREWFNVTDIRQIDVKLKSNTHVMAQREKLDKLVSENLQECNKHLRNNQR